MTEDIGNFYTPEMLGLSDTEGATIALLGDSVKGPLLKLMTALSDRSTLALRSREASLDELRILQGHCEIMRELATIIERDLPMWLAEGQRDKEAESA